MNPDISSVCRLLEQDELMNLVTLKMVNRFPNNMSFELREDADGWALLSVLEARASEWDRKTYPDSRYVVFINGNSAVGKIQLLASLPKENLVLKTSDEIVKRQIAQYEKVTNVRTFHSFTAGKEFSPPKADPGLCRSDSHDERAWEMFRANGYEDEELAAYFRNGAQWFGVEIEGQLASACFVFQNYKQIWEIGGVFTQTDFRRRGLAQIAVRGALDYLVASSLIPRYQTTTDNHASLGLARTCGLNEFLQMTHYVVPRRNE
jgi:RimJ/RimL family protein N-acetyltransferase